MACSSPRHHGPSAPLFNDFARNARREGQALHFSMKRAETDQITQIKMITICCHKKSLGYNSVSFF
jgi:hypothetical protein